MLHEIRAAIPELVDDRATVQVDPALGPGQRVQLASDVSAPAAELEVEIVLTVASRAGLMLGYSRVPETAIREGIRRLSEVL